MYKRRFTAPLHPSASKSSVVQQQLSSSQQQPTTKQLPCSQEQAAPCRASAVTPSGPASSASAELEKENAQPLADEAASKKPRLFACPAYKAPSSTLAGTATTYARPPPAEPKASDAAPARTFSVLYCNRNKFKVCCSSTKPDSGWPGYLHQALLWTAPATLPQQLQYACSLVQ
jgi:hypothetical protein